MRTTWLIAALSIALATTPLVGCGKKKEGKGKSSSKKSSKKSKKSKKSKYAEKAVDNGGKITGTVSYSGTEKDGTITITKDKAACGESAPAGQIQVKDGKLKNAVIYIEGIKEGKKWAADKVTVDNKGCVFEPRVSVGRYKGKLLARNSDPVLHNTHLFLKKGNKNLFNIALPNKDQEIEKPLRKAGLVDVKCDAHEWMQAWVWVSPHPYAAVSGADGTFEISDVPAGDYTVKLWHEKLGEKSGKAKVEAGKPVTVDFTI